VILETERLIVRPFSMGDLDEIYRLVYADPAVRDAWSGREGTPDEIKAAFAREHVGRGDGFGYRAVVLRSGDVLLGLIGFQRYDLDEETSWLVFEHGPPEGWRDPSLLECELTYALGRAYWGHGYATEAGRAMIAYGFGEMGIARIVNGTSARNRRSVDLMRRLGFAIQRNADADTQAVVGILDNNAGAGEAQ
jgi:RimJ/RimL family protein N-acetyltransferase